MAPASADATGEASKDATAKASKGANESSLSGDLQAAIEQCLSAADKQTDKQTGETAEKASSDKERNEAAVESARRVLKRFRGELDGLKYQYRTMLSIPIDGRRPPLFVVARAPWAIDFRHIYNRALSNLNALERVSSDEPVKWIGPLSECLPSARELDDARSRVLKLEPPSRSPFSARFLRSVPSLVAILIGALLLYGLIRQEKRVVGADLGEHSSLANAATQLAVIELDSADSTLTKLEKKGAPLPIVGAQGELLRQLSSAHTLEKTALDELNRVQSNAHASGADGASALTVQVSHSTGLGDVAAVMEKRATSQLFGDSALASKARIGWLSAMREYHNALAASAVSIACASDKAVNLGRDTVVQCITRKSASNGAKTPALVRLSNPWLTDGFRGRTSQDFVVKLLFALSFLLVGGGLIMLLGRWTGLLDTETIGDIAKGFATRDPKSLLSLWPFIAPLGLFAGLAGGYLLAEPSIDREPTQELSVPIAPLSPPDTSALSRLQKTVEAVRDTVDSISGRAR